jgi:hypothetical protein
MDATTRWNIAVSAETDQALRVYLAAHGEARKGGLSRFIEDAVRARLFEFAADEAKAANADVSEADIDTAVADALACARAR